LGRQKYILLPMQEIGVKPQKWSFFFFLVLGFELRAYTLSHSTTVLFFCVGFFQDRFLRTVCLGWLQIAILLISASWITRITGVSHWSLAYII
jgi:hypothetical protein